MKTKLLALSLVALLSCGCIPREYSRIGQTPVGELISVEEIVTSWNDNYRSKVETTEGVFFIYGHISSMRGVGVQVTEYDNGYSYLCVDGIDSCRRVVGN